jgi:mono/diheme cytochrome c family protein
LRATDSSDDDGVAAWSLDRRLAGVVVVATLTIASCSQGVGNPDGASAVPFGTEGLPTLEAESVAEGRALYTTFCASCHADDLSGVEDWKTPNDDGSYRPPPQDSTGHTWHHSDRLLVDLIADGSDFPQTRMPSFGDVLTDEEILSILDYFKSTWGEQERRFQWEVTQREAGTP